MTIFPATFDESHASVCRLVADFAAREAAYLAPEYQEAEARADFIDKFWIALGWDVRHEQQKNPYEQEVKVERGVLVGLAQKKADYAFFLGNYRDPRFFCEAKKPSVRIREDRDAHFQTHRYGWNSQTPLSVLMDFQEIVIVDCRRKPHIDAALTAAHRSYHYRDFEDAQKFGEIYWLFSREAVSTGKLDAYITGMPKPKKIGKQLGLLRGGDIRTVDASFLDDLETYRADLARMLKNQNAQLDGDTLTELVQRILDRLVFLRFLEDKLIEQKCRVHEFSRSAAGQSWAKFLTASRDLDVRYNGIVFKRHHLLDGGTLAVDDGDFADLCEALSSADNRYLFSYIPIHVLGSIYERFLGTVIVTTDKRARPEQKPEVRKAGGVYYTPEYIVRYICEQTVGKLIDGKTPAQIEKLRFADIACGSGSFLLGVFDLLLRYHGRWYAEHPDAAMKENLAPATKNKKKRKNVIPAVVEREGLLCLTLEKKRQILINNIYGVDLDSQAVEVAQLSLYLKLLEDETTASTRDDYLDFHEALLPSLSGNIKRGNSLVGTDILRGQFDFSTQEERKLCPMNFDDAFPHIFGPRWGETKVREMDDDGYHVDVDFQLQREAVDDADRKPVKPEKAKPQFAGGFDAIVGNPPWGAELGQPALEYVRTMHREIIVRMIDSFMFFMNRASAKIRDGGFLGMIVPDVFFYQTDNARLRAFFLTEYQLTALANMGDVFEQVTRPAAIICGCKVKAEGDKVLVADLTTATSNEKSSRLAAPESFVPVLQDVFRALPGQVFVTRDVHRFSVWDKVRRIACKPLADVVDGDGIQRGVSPDLKDAFLVSSSAVTEHGLEAEALRPVLTGGHHVRRYLINRPDLQVIYTSREDDFRKLPNICRFIDGFRSRITCKEVKEGKHPIYALHRPREASIFLKEPKLLGVITGDKVIVALDSEKTFVTDGLYLFGISPEFDPRFVMGVLNSDLFVFLYSLLAVEGGRVLAQVKPTVIARLPIRTLDLADTTQKAQHDRLVHLVEAMLKAKAQVSTAKTDSDRNYLEDKCAGLDRQIDQLVYELYALTPEEVALVENNPAH